MSQVIHADARRVVQPAVDPRPTFFLAVTGHSEIIPGGLWQSLPDPRRAADVPGVRQVWQAIDRALARRKGNHRVSLFCRGYAEFAGVDDAVRFYAERHRLQCLPLSPMRDVWGDSANFRRDLEMVGRSHAVLWFGEEESDGDPARLAMVLGVPVQVVRDLG